MTQDLSVLYISPLFSEQPIGNFARFHDIVHNAGEVNIDPTIVAINHINDCDQYDVKAPATDLSKPAKAIRFLQLVQKELNGEKYSAIHVISSGILSAYVPLAMCAQLAEEIVIYGPNFPSSFPYKHLDEYPVSTSYRELLESAADYYSDQACFSQEFDSLLFQGEFHRSHLHKYWNISPSNEYIFPTRVDTRLFSPNPSIEPTQPGEDLILGILETDSPIKCTPVFTKALSRLDSSIQIDTIGGKTSHFDTIHESRITRRGRIERPKMAEFFHHIDAFVFPSQFENSPTIVAESLASGCPVIGSDIPPIRELIKEGTDGLLFEPGSAKDLASKIKQFNSERELIQQRVRQRYERWDIRPALRDLRQLYRTGLSG